MNERDGVLILSENAGAHEELGDWALTVNPFDVAGQAEAIHRALEMPADERRAAARGDPRVGARARPRRLDRRCSCRLSTRQPARVSPCERPSPPRGELRPVNPATLEPVGAVPVTRPDVAHGRREARLRAGGVGAVVVRGAARAARARRARFSSRAWTRSPRRSSPRPASRSSRRTRPSSCSALEQLVWLARNVERVLAPERVRYRIPYLAHKRARVVYEPLGVVAVISPWNFPFSIPLTQVATAVAAGNAVVLKPSELTPLSGAWVARVFAEAGAPRGLVQVVQGDGETGAALVERAGRREGHLHRLGRDGPRRSRAAAGELLRAGDARARRQGPDARLRRRRPRPRRRRRALGRRSRTAARSASGVERIYVARALYERVRRRARSAARALRIGRGDDPATDLGPLISEQQRDEGRGARRGRARARRRGASPARRRPDVGLPGWFYEPTVLVGRRPRRAHRARGDLRPGRDASQPFDDEDEAVAARERLAVRARRERLDARRRRARARSRRASRRASVWTNDVGYSYGAGQAPWGGARSRASGARTRSTGCTSCSQRRSSSTPTRGRVPVPWWYPYDAARARRRSAACSSVLYGDGTACARAWRAPPRPRAPRAALRAPMSELSHVDESGDGPDGGRRREAALAPPRRRVARACAWRRRRRSGCASCRRATRSRRRSSPGSWPRSGRRADPALSSAAAHAHRRRRSMRRRRRRDHRDRRDDGADRRRDGGA